MRKVYLTVKTRLILRIDEDVSIPEVIDEMYYDFRSQSDGADIEDMEIIDFDVDDSK